MPEEKKQEKESFIIKADDLAKFEEGKNANDWLLSPEAKDVWVEHAGKKWHFKVRVPSWGTLLAIGEKSREMDPRTGQSMGINNMKYQRELLKAIVVECPFGTLTDVTFSQLSPAGGQVLTSLLETLDLGLKDGEAGKDSGVNLAPS